MTQQRFNRVAGAIFSVIAALHAARIILGWEAVIGGWMVPHWISWAAVLLFGALASVAFKQK